MAVTREEIEEYVQRVYVERREPSPSTRERTAFVLQCRRDGMLEVYVECFERYYAPKRAAAEKRAEVWLASAYADEVRTHLLRHYTSDLEEIERRLQGVALTVDDSVNGTKRDVAQFAMDLWSTPKPDLMTVLQFSEILEREGLDGEEG